ncbi:MAG: 3-oxoacyl-ACP reductase [Rhizobiales bacterium PAR1]|nr:MAG: 3-oxoacyl-ACP reductase [Rhizobiales bacterium PAR1]
MGIPAGQTAIITGGARGIGHGIAKRLARGGCRVILWDVDFAAFEAEVQEFTPLLTQKVDVSDYASVEAAFAEALRVAGSIEILVNNAGINGPVLPFWEYPVETWHKVRAIDLDSVFYCCRVAVPHMRAQKYGRIVNIASMAGKDGVPFISGYSAAKAGVIGFTKAIAKELAQDGVIVNAIAPAMAETGLMKEMTQAHIDAMKAKIPMGRFLQIDEVGALVAWIASPECSFTTGFVFDLSGGRTTY